MHEASSALGLLVLLIVADCRYRRSMPKPVSTGLSRLLVRLAPLMDDRVKASAAPFDHSIEFRPYAGSRLWGWTHFGVFVPSLPGPHRYLNTMTLIGSTGTEIFDNDHLVDGDARGLSTVFSSTASSGNHHYRGYQPDDCAFEDDGSTLMWGDNLTIEVDLPTVNVVGRYDTFSVDLTLDVTDQVSYFVRAPFYQHLSLLAPYQGTITDHDGVTAISGLGTFEYARAMSQQALTKRAMPGRLKLPMDFFTYQVIQIDETTQMLLTRVEARGQAACNLVHIRSVGGTAEAYEDVHFEVLTWADPIVDELGRSMRMPRDFRWQVRDADGRSVLDLTGECDSPMRFGHGRGYAGAFTYEALLRGESKSGTAYIEWVDVRP